MSTPQQHTPVMQHLQKGTDLFSLRPSRPAILNSPVKSCGDLVGESLITRQLTALDSGANECPLALWNCTLQEFAVPLTA